MRQSQLFTKTLKDAPRDEESTNAKLLIRAGFVHKEMAGVYAYLPLGLRVIEKIKNIIREEMNALGSEELIMTSLQRKELWQKTDRWDDKNVDVWFKTELKNGIEVGLAWSHEEQISEMMKNYISSYRDLPISVYQFQTKLRNELRAKSGILRGREFVMKDLYSYSRNEQEHQVFYEKVTQAYLRVFERVGLGEITFLTFASGGAFTQFSHEFQTLTQAGEDTIYVDRAKKIAINKEVLTNQVLSKVGVHREDLEEVKAAEVGNIFSFGGSKSEQLDLIFKERDGTDHPVILGSYGIGVTRLMGVVAEVFHDERGILWPRQIAPALVHLIVLEGGEQKAEALYKDLQDKGVEVLYDDRRDSSPGEKFTDADLIGIPLRVVVSAKTLSQKKVEVKKRNEKQEALIDENEIMAYIQSV